MRTEFDALKQEELNLYISTIEKRQKFAMLCNDENLKKSSIKKRFEHEKILKQIDDLKDFLYQQEQKVQNDQDIKEYTLYLAKIEHYNENLQQRQKQMENKIQENLQSQQKLKEIINRLVRRIRDQNKQSIKMSEQKLKLQRFLNELRGRDQSVFISQPVQVDQLLDFKQSKVYTNYAQVKDLQT